MLGGSRKIFVIVGVLALLIAVAVAWQWPRQPEIPSYLNQLGGDFELQSVNGKVRLSDFQGKVALVYFGYAHCPDICPSALTLIGNTIRQLDSEQQQQVQSLFISLDPRRDTPESLKGYAAFFQADMLGLTDSPKHLQTVADLWRVDYHVPDEPADSNYAVAHSNFIYLVNPAGKVAALFDERASNNDIAAAIVQWLD